MHSPKKVYNAGTHRAAPVATMKRQHQQPLANATAEQRIAELREGELTSTRKNDTMKTGSLRLLGSVSLVSLLSLLGAPFASQAGGTVVGWGGGTAAIPVGLTNVVAIAAGYAHGLALNPDTTVTAWGTYWLSDIDFGRDYVPTLVPAGLSNVVAVAAGGGTFSLALQADGKVVGWGYNGGGQTTIPGGLSDVVAIGICSRLIEA